jgi:uncharacterized membrane protein
MRLVRRAPDKLPDDPTIEQITHANIASILRVEDARRRRKPLAYRLVERIARFCGTIGFLWINVGWFAAWILANRFVVAFDPYPYTLLLLCVSLEAIVLSVLILISQNMSAAESEQRHHLDLQINLLNEREMTAMLRLSMAMAERLGIDEAQQREVAALAEETDPAAVLHQIVEAEAAQARPEEPTGPPVAGDARGE